MPDSAVPPDPSHFAAEWLQLLAERGQTKVFPPRTIIIHEGDPSGALFIIKEGTGKIYSTNEAGREIVYNTYAPGDILGEPSLDGGVRTASVMTIEKTVCSVVRAADFKQLVSENTEFAFHVIVRLIRLVRTSNEHIKSLALEDVYGRVVRLLMKRAEPIDHGGGHDGGGGGGGGGAGGAAGGGWIVRERLTQQNIADRVGSSREMVSRIFKDLERGGYITVQKDAIAIHRKPPPGW